MKQEALMNPANAEALQELYAKTDLWQEPSR